MKIFGEVRGGVVVMTNGDSLPEGTAVRIEPVKHEGKEAPVPEGEQSLSEFLLSMSGTVKGLPADMARNHDHYLYGTPRK